MKFKMFKSRAPEPLSTVPETLREVVAVGTPRALSLWLTDVDHDLMGNQIDDLDVPQAERQKREQAARERGEMQAAEQGGGSA